MADFLIPNLVFPVLSTSFLRVTPLVLVLLFSKTAIGYTQSANPDSIRTKLSGLIAADPAAAERYCTENLAQSPPALRAYLHVQRGVLRTTLNRMPDARRDLDEAVSWTAQHPDDSMNPYALQALATWFQVNGQPDSANCFCTAHDTRNNLTRTQNTPIGPPGFTGRFPSRASWSVCWEVSSC